MSQNNREDLTLHFKRPHTKVWREASSPYTVDRKIEIIYPESAENL